jgi:serine/threonine protein kinase
MVAVDIWAAGCAIGELLTGRPLLPGDSDRSQLEQVSVMACDGIL